MGIGLFSRLRRGGARLKPSKLTKYEGAQHEFNPDIFGPKISGKRVPASAVLVGGGIGDYLNWCAAISMIRDVYTHVDLKIFAGGLFIDVVEYLYGDVPYWRVHPRSEVNKHHVQGSSLIAPKPGSQLLNACGTHLMDLGFAYYACMNPPPKEFNFLPRIKYEKPFPAQDFLPDRYAVFTPGATSSIREMPVKAFDELLDYTIGKGITPVFLGKHQLMERYSAAFLPYAYHKGVDLRERTNLLEAAAVIEGAEFVIGMDNGLLHLTGCTETPVIFGMNVTEVHHRNLRRKRGLSIYITSDKSLTPCIGCQSRMRFVPGHDFRNCFYTGWGNERRCLTDLFKDDAAVWKKAIDLVLATDPKDKHIEKTLLVT